MKKPFLGLRTVIYLVPDLETATQWYEKAFQVEPYFQEPFYVGFDIGGYELGLMPADTPSEKKATSVMTYWGVENVEEHYDRLLVQGASSEEEPHNVGGDLVVAAVKDPWGNVIGLIYNPSFKLN